MNIPQMEVVGPHENYNSVSIASLSLSLLINVWEPTNGELLGGINKSSRSSKGPQFGLGTWEFVDDLIANCQIYIGM